jgi:hypothetical protein
MKEVSREENYDQIQIVYDCTCGRTPSAIFEFGGFYDEDDNPIEASP